jgi:hypothetical protein
MFRKTILVIAKRIKNAKQIFKYFDYHSHFGLFGYYMEGTKFFVVREFTCIRQDLTRQKNIP